MKTYRKRRVVIEGLAILWAVEYEFHGGTRNYVVCWCDFESDADKVLEALIAQESAVVYR